MLEPPTAEIERTDTGIYVLKIQGGNLEPATINGTTPQINLQKHLPISLSSNCGAGLSFEGSFTRTTVAPGNIYMRAEYIPPREDVIMQNEASCDFHILVSREIEIISCHMDKEMVLEALKSGDMFGEISALCNRPQSFTVNCADSIVGDAKVREISGGEKKRLSVACKLIASPSVIFADEPTTGCFGHNKYIYFFNTSNSA